MPAMEDRFVTSEEKLLKVIRKQDKLRAVKKAPAQPNGGDLRKDSTISLLKICNRLFIIISICFVGFLVYKSMQLQKTEAVKLQAVDQDVPPSEAAPIAIDEEILVSSPEVTVTRDIFEAPWEQPQQTGTATTGESSALAPQLKTTIRLSGIVLDQKNPQAIVEEISSGETVFLSKGQEFKGATLVDLEEGKAFFMYQNERIELTP